MRISLEDIKPAGNGKVTKEAIDFQSDGLAIELEPLPLRARLSLFFVLMIIVSAITWAWHARIDRIVIAQGSLATKEPLIVLQPLEKSVIREFKVRVGDSVKAGDTVALLDSTFAAADLTSSRSELSSLLAKIARLEAEIDDFSEIKKAIGISSAHLKIQKRILQIRKKEYQSKLDLMKAKEHKMQSELTGLDKNKIVILKRRAIVEKRNEMEQKLRQNQIGYRDKFLTAASDQLKVSQEITELENKVSDIGQRKIVLKYNREAFVAEWWSKVEEKLEQSNRRRYRIENELAKAKRRTNLVELRSPVDAIVLDRAQRSVGSVAESAKPLVTLVPNNAIIEGNVEIPSRYIALLDVGNKVRVKLEAFPFQKYGTLSGTIISIAPSSRQKQQQKSEKEQQKSMTYNAIIKLTSEKLSGLEKNIRLIPGMVVSAEIIVGKRSVLSYFVYPIIRKLDETAREAN